MKTQLLHRSFAGGEISPELLSRVDDVRFATGVRRALNWVTLPHGPARRRPGFQFVRAAGNAALRQRLIPFRYSSTEAYALEFGARSGGSPDPVGYIRLHTNGATVLVPTGGSAPRAYVTAQNASVVTIATDQITFGSAHGLLTGDEIEFTTSGTIWPGIVVGTRYYAVVVDATNIKLATTQAAALAGTPVVDLFGAGVAAQTRMHRSYRIGELVTSGGAVYYCRIDRPLGVTPGTATHWYVQPADGALEIPAIWAESELREIKYSQSFDVLRLTHRNKPLTTLSRLGATYWRIESSSVQPAISPPANVRGVALQPAKIAVSGITAGSDRFDIAVDHQCAIANGDQVKVTGMAVANVPAVQDGWFEVANITVSANGTSGFSLRRLDGTNIDLSGAGAFTPGFIQIWPRGINTSHTYVVTAVDAAGVETAASNQVTLDNVLGATGCSNRIIWDTVPGAVRYRVYKKQSGVFGFIGEVDGTTTPYTSSVTYSATNPMVLTYTGVWDPHQIVEGVPIVFSTSPGGTLPTTPALSATSVYFIRRVTLGASFVSTTPDGANIDGTGLAGNTGTQFITRPFSFVDDAFAPQLGDLDPRRDANDIVTAGNYPGAVGYHEGRLFAGGSMNEPYGWQASRAGTELDFSYSLPIAADDRLKERLPGRQGVELRHFVSLRSLVVLGSDGAYIIDSLNGEALAPGKILQRSVSRVGASHVTPQVLAASILYSAERGSIVRELGAGPDGVADANLSSRSLHLFESRTVVDGAWMASPFQVSWWITDIGELLGLTFLPEEQVAGWHVQRTSGPTPIFESICVVPEGREDRVYVTVSRTLAGPTVVRTVERLGLFEPANPDLAMSHVALDGAIVVDGTGTATIGGLSHLAGLVVRVILDGAEHPDCEVSPSGTITVSSTTWTQAIVGLPFDSDLEFPPIAAGVEAQAQGRTKAINRTILRVRRTAGIYVAQGDADLQDAGLWVSDPFGALTDGVVDVAVPATHQVDGNVRVFSNSPWPAMVVGCTVEVSIGG